jgi:hypothetical protein
MKYCGLAGTLALLVLALGVDSLASTIRVPQDQPTIQAGINAASNGDTVLVAPGTYFENIDFVGKAITVMSSGGASLTVIDGGNVESVVTFDSYETPSSVLAGFTLQNGNASIYHSLTGGGIYVDCGSPTIAKNVIRQNQADSGAGIGVLCFSSGPLITDNKIIANGNSIGSIGGGIYMDTSSSVTTTIRRNEIRGNTGYEFGGGIAIFAGKATIEDNTIVQNFTAGQGGGVWIITEPFVFLQNLIAGNTAAQGGGIYFTVPFESQPVGLVNNTIGGARGINQGSAVWVGGYANKAYFFNNIMVGLTGQNAVWCDNTNSGHPPTFTNNDAWSPNGTGLQGTCATENQQNGNISANPLWMNPLQGDFRLRSSSPAINAGDNNAPDLPAKDFAGNPRIVGGIIDMGAYEYQGNEKQ